MLTLLADEPVHESTSPAQWLRQIAAAVRVSFTWWGVHRSLTDQQKEEVGLACSADTRLLTAGKKLIDTRNETYRKLTSLRSRIANYWRGLTLPYVEPGMRLIRQEDIDSFVHVMEGYRDELKVAEHDLDSAYDRIRSDARQRLGRLYNPGDYPPSLLGLFGVEWDFPSVEPPSYLMRLNPALYEQEQQRVTQRFEEAVRLAEQAFLGEFGKLVEHLCERLSTSPDGERKIFRDTVLENLTDFFDKFKKLNVRSNADLDYIVQRAQDLVRGVNAPQLRTGPWTLRFPNIDFESWADYLGDAIGSRPSEAPLPGSDADHATLGKLASTKPSLLLAESGTPAYMSPEQARGEDHRFDGRSAIFDPAEPFDLARCCV